MTQMVIELPDDVYERLKARGVQMGCDDAAKAAADILTAQILLEKKSLDRELEKARVDGESIPVDEDYWKKLQRVVEEGD